MTAVKENHNQAMEIAFFANRERRRGNAEKAADLFRQALDYELSALEGMDESDGMSWAVLRRSAGWLWTATSAAWPSSRPAKSWPGIPPTPTLSRNCGTC